MCECMHLLTQIKSSVSIIQCLNSYFSIIEIGSYYSLACIRLKVSQSSYFGGSAITFIIDHFECPKCIEFYKLLL